MQSNTLVWFIHNLNEQYLLQVKHTFRQFRDLTLESCPRCALLDIQKVNLTLWTIILKDITEHAKHLSNLDNCRTRSFNSFQVNETS